MAVKHVDTSALLPLNGVYLAFLYTAFNRSLTTYLYFQNNRLDLVSLGNWRLWKISKTINFRSFMFRLMVDRQGLVYTGVAFN